MKLKGLVDVAATGGSMQRGRIGWRCWSGLAGTDD